MKRNYPATPAGLRRMKRDLERSAKPIRIPLQGTCKHYGYPIPPHARVPGSEVHNHYGPMVQVSGTGHAVAVGDYAHAGHAGPGEERDLLALLRNVLARLDELELDTDGRDEVHDAVGAAERIAANEPVDRTGLARRAARVLQVLGQVAASPGANALAEALAEPIRAMMN